MVAIKDYCSGRAAQMVKTTIELMDASDKSLKETGLGQAIQAESAKVSPKKITPAHAIELITNAEHLAIGERTCRALQPDMPLTEAVFLDELALALVEAGKARAATREEAVENINKYSKKPIIASIVAGRYLEICPSWPKGCLFWNMEKHGLKCIARRAE